MGSRLARRFFKVFKVFFLAVAGEAEVEGAADELLLACCGGAPATGDGARKRLNRSAAVTTARVRDDEREEFKLARRIFVLCRN